MEITSAVVKNLLWLLGWRGYILFLKEKNSLNIILNTYIYINDTAFTLSSHTFSVCHKVLFIFYNYYFEGDPLLSILSDFTYRDRNQNNSGCVDVIPL